MDEIEVFVVDDSALMRKIISDMINEEKSMKVINTCRDGFDLFEKLKSARPDVITLDLEMPNMDGLSVLKEMKKRNIHIPVIVLSSISKTGLQLTMDCLEVGAFDFLPKPSGSISLDINKVKSDLIDKIKTAYKKCSINSDITPKIIKKEFNSINRVYNDKKINAVVIGASTGGPKALYKVITTLPEDLNIPVFVVQHMPAGFTKAFAERLNNNSRLKVIEANDGDPININTVYIAPGGYHMLIGTDKKIHLNTEPTIWGVRPAVDKLFISASNVYFSSIISLVLTGMGRDGAAGTIEIKKNGGITLSEDESTCTIYGMPKVAYETGAVDEVLPIDEMSKRITGIVKSYKGGK